MVKICDSIMGSGKTEAAIHYINSHPEKRFLYLTPYLAEAARIKKGCPDAHFTEPSRKIPEYDYKKYLHIQALIEEGENITTTHRALAYFTPQTIQKLKDMGYTMIVDEILDVLQSEEGYTQGDIDMAIDAGYIQKGENGEYHLSKKEYTGGKFNKLFKMMESRPVVRLGEGSNSQKCFLTYWLLSKEMFFEIPEILILTYLFKGSEMDLFFQMWDIPHEFIGVVKTPEGKFSFGDRDFYVPEYVAHIHDLIHIEGNTRLNYIGDRNTSLSMNWYEKSPENREAVRKNLSNYFMTKMKAHPQSEKLCGTYKKQWGSIRGQGFYRNGVVFSMRSSNEYRNRTVLAYPVNLYVNRNITQFYAKRGLNYEHNTYALSTMLQWIWRSAIRDGKEIWIYIPSRRMRTLLYRWMNSVCPVSIDQKSKKNDEAEKRMLRKGIVRRKDENNE